MNHLKQTEFAALAQAFVEATSPLVSGRTINIMAADGTILASTEKERIGTYHHGARLAAETGKPVIIDAENVSRYPGAKEGANLPILDNGQVIGVVGLYGEEKEIRDAANLLGVYVTQFFRQQRQYREKKSRQKNRTRLLQMLLSGIREENDEARSLCRALGLQLQPPFILLGIGAQQDTETLQDLAEQMDSWWETDRLLRRGNLFGMPGQILLVLHSLEKGEKERLRNLGEIREGLLGKLLDQAERKSFLKLAASHCCGTLEELPEAGREVELLLEEGEGAVASAENPQDAVCYLLARMENHGGGALARRKLHQLEQEVSPGQVRMLLDTARAYYEEEGALQKAADRLAIHKNTLQYRLHRLYEGLGLENTSGFAREFVIRLLLAENKGKK